ncbi:HlyD family efflux transporter periplasmic adaptor subunit [Sulfurospirillum arsenophilum]|uniref:HlyD family efflux transporter periplasmic adaptor subunit n=1 Tax=Sulfurospirillum arsenophilum TaxID=56698 RepID=UPI0005AA11D7|nr:HlyD family efflux transporter periplasmic adaptor subunit [Sulfurospirillum arsenophilum]
MLLKLREDIEISASDEEQWTLHDRASGKYYRLNELSFTILSFLQQAKTADELLSLAKQYVICTEADVQETLEFCKRNFLMQLSKEHLNDLVTLSQKRTHVKWYTKLIHSYLFFKIHLFNPDIFLEKTLKFVEFVYTRSFFWMIVFLFSLNILFIFDRFPEFISTLTNFATLDGLIYMALSIVIVKLIHELGHAYTAKRAKCYVPSMGIAFMVFYPMPYTDTSDAWKLPHKQRMHIALAGIKAELIVASFAMGAWLYLADGLLKSLAFFMIAVSLISMLVVNLTPFMRYDGYYVLSDYLGIENLHQRAFLQAKAFIKKHLWGIRVPVEPFPKYKRNFLILFALVTWGYRFGLFLGIAYLVYNHAFKALGILLFWIEIWFFVLQPIFREVKEWYQLRSKTTFHVKLLVNWVILCLVGLLFLIPYTTTLRLPAVIDSNTTTVLYADYDAQLISIRPEGAIHKGDLIFSATSISNDLDRQIAQRKRDLFQQQSANAFTSNDTMRDHKKYQQMEQGEEFKIDAANAIQDHIDLYASVDGILEYNTPLSKGESVGAAQPIGRIIDPTSLLVSAYISDVDLSYIKEGMEGELFDTLTCKTIKVKIESIEHSPIHFLNEPLLNSNYKGAITVGKENIPERSKYKLTLRVIESSDMLYYRHVGEVKITIHSISFFEKMLHSIVSLFLRENSF